MTITISPETEAKLWDKAHREGRNPDVIADSILGIVLDAEAREEAETAARVQEAMAAADAGREKPLEQYIAEQKAKRGLPDAWPSATLVETTFGMTSVE